MNFYFSIHLAAIIKNLLIYALLYSGCPENAEIRTQFGPPQVTEMQTTTKLDSFIKTIA